MPLFGSHGLLAQDIFHTTDSKQIETKVLEVSDDEVSNKMFNAANGVKIGPLGAKTANNAPSGPNHLPLGALAPRTSEFSRYFAKLARATMPYNEFYLGWSRRLPP